MRSLRYAILPVAAATVLALIGAGTTEAAPAPARTGTELTTGVLAAGNVPVVGGTSDQLLDLPRSFVPVVIADLRCLVPVCRDARIRDRCGHYRQDRGDGERGHGVAAQLREICHNGIHPRGDSELAAPLLATGRLRTPPEPVNPR